MTTWISRASINSLHWLTPTQVQSSIIDHVKWFDAAFARWRLSPPCPAAAWDRWFFFLFCFPHSFSSKSEIFVSQTTMIPMVIARPKDVNRKRWSRSVYYGSWISEWRFCYWFTSSIVSYECQEPGRLGGPEENESWWLFKILIGTVQRRSSLCIGLK